MSAVDRGHPAYRGQAAYNRLFLSIYDTYVYGISSPVAWRCPKRHLLDLYDRHVAADHLDVGVATGLLLDQCRFPVADPRLTLMDLNGVSLAHAARRLRRYAPRVHRADVLEPWGLPPDSVDSIGMFNLLHCLPGALPDKAVVFDHARAVLRPGGTLFGTTILGQGPAHNWLARGQLAAANWRGIMSNRRDRRADLEAALARAFTRYDVTVVGSVALFVGHADS
ncbi:class I SAM-dependent methyltransferase [Streptomyces sp. DSM 44915]|uniref:Class I SAM-dependent methyltransferase n=1 Tax=Streptomyces chisholmiae TaxID=3075540 RepID=A0ABU2JV21_9ACTN|nr:class I SAM-dependent methyltransferase [Streptomyces sp. DSM 44915]MDT0268747.1 class I SAM-dependent methyltransferase [Streptomyces sp. DSM 44915]